MEFLYLLEKIRTPFLDFLMALITHIGEETVFLAVAIFFFWCVSKREGYYILVSGLIGTLVNQLLKITLRIDRPWVKDPNFSIVESAREEATGFSFPSGHTQNVTSTFGAIARFSGRMAVRVCLLVLIALVAFSRMYLGVHTPYDVVASLVIASLILFVLYPVFSDDTRMAKYMPYLIGVCALLSVAFLVYVFLLPESGFDSEAISNLHSARKNATTLFACMLGLAIAYPIERKFINFKTEAKWYSSIIKLAVGFAIVLAIKSGLKAPLEMLFSFLGGGAEYVARGVRYLIIVLFAALVWPLTFGAFARLRIGFLDRFTELVKSKFSPKRDTPSSIDE